MSDSISNECNTGGADNYFGLRVASVFIILIGSLGGALFPVVARRSKHLNVPKAVFDFAKYFGSGVIIATGFIHLLSPALDALSSPCLSPAWQDYPYALAFCLLSIFSIFVVELVAFRWGTAKLEKLGLKHDPHGHGVGGTHAAHGPESSNPQESDSKEKSLDSVDIEAHHNGGTESDLKEKSLDSVDIEAHHHHHGGAVVDSPIAQIIGVGILEFGVVLHSLLIGLTLAVNQDFKILFIVLVFHQTFEGLGVGTRLAYLDLPEKYRSVPYYAAIIFGATTPLGIAIGLGVRSSYNPGSATASIVSGTLDSLSSGILIYTGLVELLAHEFLFNKEMMNGSNGKLAYALSCMLLGCGIMALLGRWA